MDTKSKNGREKIANFLKFLFFTYIYVFILLNLQIIYSGYMASIFFIEGHLNFPHALF